MITMKSLRYLAVISPLILSSCEIMDPNAQGGYNQGGYQQPQPGYGANSGAYVPPGYQQAPQQPSSGSYYPPQAPPPQSPYGQQQSPQPPARSDYLPHLSQEYRNGYDIGAKDRQAGYPRDHRRGYERFGRGYESYFQEGYADGYDGNRIRH